MIETELGLFNAGAFGLLACFLLRRSGNLWMPIGLHMAFDWGETYFYGVPNSGQVVPGRLLNASSSGAAWLSGGTVGPEGSVLCTFLIVVLWLICAAGLREVRYPKPTPTLTLDREGVEPTLGAGAHFTHGAANSSPASGEIR